MNCPRCGASNSAGRRFCAECASPLVLVCSGCGFSNEPGVKFCGGCGSALGAPAATPGPRFGPFDSYTPKHLAEKILTSKSALEGERKLVTVLFADLKSSMQLLADRDPEEARKLLDPVLEHMMEAVHRYEGTVNQVMGDGIMALFGAPVAREDHAVRACYAALRMQEQVKRYAEEVHRSEGVPIEIRVGLNSGEVVVRSIGSDLRMDYTAVGQTTHLAARMEQMARAGTILISSNTLRLAEGYLAVKPLGPRPVRGLDVPVEVYEILGAGTVRSRLHAAAARGLTRFVGRDRELDQLREALERARSGHGQVVAVVGEPGVGKSRLYWEFTHSHHTQGCLIVESSSVSYGKATPYLPVIDLLKAYFQIEGREEFRTIREKVTGKLLTLDEALSPTLPALLALLEVPVDDDQWQGLDPPQRRQRTLDAVKRLLLRESQRQPLVIVFEDLHWIDGQTQALLDGLVESLPTARLLLLCNYRPEYEHHWGSRSYYTQLTLDLLAPESTHELLDTLIGQDASVDALKPVLIERTEGNPFFLEESVRTLVETGVLVGERCAYRLARPLASFQVPATVHAVLAARIDRLTSEERHLLQTAAVVGTDVPFPVLQAIAEVPDAALHRDLAHLQAAEFLYETSLFPEHAYTFKHSLTHEVAYGSLLQDRRRVLHARIVEVLEGLHPDRLGEQIERLAHHALRGEVWDKAMAYFRRAGEKAMARSAHREAAGYFEQALGALTHLPEGRETLAQAIDLRLALRPALWPSGDFRRILALLREAEALAAALDDSHRLGQVSRFLSLHFYYAGMHDQAIAAAERAVALARASGEVVLRALANHDLGLSHQARGDYPRAIACFTESVASLGETGSRERFGQVFLPAVLSYAFLAGCHAELGLFAEGRVLGDEGLRIAEAVDHPGSLMFACWGLGLLSLRKGELIRAVRLLERAVGICQEANFPVYFPRMAVALGSAYTLDGRVSDAMPLLRQAMERTRATEMGRYHVLCSVPLAEAQALAGLLEEAQTVAERALALTREHHERGDQAYALRLLGDIAALRAPPEAAQAEAHYRQALALAGELGMRPLIAHCHLGLAKLFRHTGKRHEAQEYLSIATSMYREMDMDSWLEQAEREA
jgi:class 3 adenylate cyclase/tetratricopeptide (TPR) repeat protein